MRRTKIVATLGPVSQGPAEIDSLIDAGADVLRLNLAHGEAEIHATTARSVREAAVRSQRVVGLLADLPGPKMRTGSIDGDEMTLEPGEILRLGARVDVGTGDAVQTSVDLAGLVEPGDEVFLADAQIILEVRKVEDGVVHAEVIRGGTLRSGKGMHVPGAELKLESFSEHDAECLECALDIGVDMVGVSFVRTAADVERVKERLTDRGPKAPAIVAKIETRSAVENLRAIVQVADAIMVARGDLGIQLPYVEVPSLQKDIIGICNAAGTPVITATQMLESMTHSPLPTRAEVNDVANAVMDGTDAVMLSEETAVGEYPVDAVKVMNEIAVEAEQRQRTFSVEVGTYDDPVSWAIARAAVQASEELGVATILCPTRSGSTARRVAAFRPSMPILAIDHSIETLQALTVVWGVVPFQVPYLEEEELAAHGLDRALEAARRSGLARPGDRATLVAGGSTLRAGATDLVRILNL